MSEYIFVCYSRDQIPAERLSKVADVVDFAASTVFKLFLLLLLPLFVLSIGVWIATGQFNPVGMLVVGDVIGVIVAAILSIASQARNSCLVRVEDLIVETGNEMLKAREISDVAFEKELSKYISCDELESINNEVKNYLGKRPDKAAMAKIVTLIKTYISPIVEEIARHETPRLEKAARLEDERLRELNADLETRNYGVSKSLGN